MRTTIKDVAKECGVSVATVSLALSDKPNRISEATRRHIKECAQRLRYSPNKAAASLANKKSKVVEIVVVDIANTHIASLFMAINHVLQKKGYSTMCHVLENSNTTSALELLRQISGENIDALVWGKPLEIGQEAEWEEFSEYVKALQIPVFGMDDLRIDAPGTDVCFDYRSGGYLATKHLIEMGHMRIGCLTGDTGFKVTGERLEGYRQALDEAGIAFDNKLVYHGNYAMESGFDSLSYLLGQKVTAVFSFNDEMAFGIYQGARNYGIKIPEDLSVIGFDNVPFTNVLEVPLSTVRVPSDEMGGLIGNEIVRVLENQDFGERKKILYSPDLMLKGSTMKRKTDES